MITFTEYITKPKIDRAFLYDGSQFDDLVALFHEYGYEIKKLDRAAKVISVYSKETRNWITHFEPGSYVISENNHLIGGPIKEFESRHIIDKNISDEIIAIIGRNKL